MPPRYLISTFLLCVALWCGVLGFGVFIGTTAIWLKVGFVVFLVLFLFSLIWDDGRA